VENRESREDNPSDMQTLGAFTPTHLTVIKTFLSENLKIAYQLLQKCVKKIS